MKAFKFHDVLIASLLVSWSAKLLIVALVAHVTLQIHEFVLATYSCFRSLSSVVSIDDLFQARVIRVLNLWQKNSVFPVEIIQPLLDLTSDPNNSNSIANGENWLPYVSHLTLFIRDRWMLQQACLLFFFFAFPSYISGVHHFWVRFLRMWPFFNPTIKVVTFCLRGWCVLGVFLLPAFTRLGHERQDLLSPCDEVHVCTD